MITGRRQRRNWTDEEKARIIAESVEPDVNISAVARRLGVNRSLLNVWCCDAGLTSQRSAKACAQQPMFVPATVVGDKVANQDASPDVGQVPIGRIEIEIAGGRHRQSSFDPQLLAKYQRWFPGFDDKIVSMCAHGMSTARFAISGQRFR